MVEDKARIQETNRRIQLKSQKEIIEGENSRKYKSFHKTIHTDSKTVKESNKDQKKSSERGQYVEGLSASVIDSSTEETQPNGFSANKNGSHDIGGLSGATPESNLTYTQNKQIYTSQDKVKSKKLHINRKHLHGTELQGSPGIFKLNKSSTRPIKPADKITTKDEQHTTAEDVNMFTKVSHVREVDGFSDAVYVEDVNNTDNKNVPVKEGHSVETVGGHKYITKQNDPLVKLEKEKATDHGINYSHEQNDGKNDITDDLEHEKRNIPDVKIEYFNNNSTVRNDPMRSKRPSNFLRNSSIENLDDDAQSGNGNNVPSGDILSQGRARAARVREICLNLNSTQSHKEKSTLDHYILVDDKYKTLYCAVSKCGSSAWKNVLVRLRTDKSVSETQAIHVHEYLQQFGLSFLSDLSKEEQTFRLEKYFKYMIVRHPLERVVSAWRDKLVLDDDPSYRKTLGKAIREHNTRSQTLPADAGDNITLAEVVEYLVDRDPSTWDRHFLSVYHHCHPCEINYDFVAKVETLKTDSDDMYREMGITNGPDLFAVNTFKHKPGESILKDYENVTLGNYATLLNMYSRDLLLFDYHIPSILRGFD